MPSWVGASLGSQGLRLPLLQSLPMLQIVAAAKRAGLALGLRERLKHAVRCTFGVPLAPPTPPRSPPAEQRARRRVFALPRPVSMVVLLSPGLPCRLEPSLSATAVCWRRAGDVVVAVATCEGWLELLAGGGGGARRGGGRRFWVLQEGARAGQPGPLLRALSAGDVTSGGRCMGAARSDADSALLARNQALAAARSSALVAAAAPSAAASQAEALPAEAPRWSTLEKGGQLRRERELQMLLSLAHLSETPSCLEALLSTGASVETLRSSSIEGVHAIARRAGLPFGQRARLTNAVRSHLHREPAAPQERQETENGDR